jgi:glucosylceramidase
MSANSRRTFLKQSSIAAASLALSKKREGWTRALDTSQQVCIWRTSQDGHHVLVEPLIWQPRVDHISETIALHPESTRQEVLGFGAALTDSSCYVLSQIPDHERLELMSELFGFSGMALNVCQTCIGSSDYSLKTYSFDESDDPDPELKKFSIAHDREYILPILREARNQNFDLFLFSTPWSPPGWMKSGSSILGGSMRKSSYDPYARYILKFLEAYEKEGIQIQAVIVQNEADTDQDGRMPACLWGQEYEIEFVKEHLGPLLRSSVHQTKIWILDHNYNLWGRAIGELSDPDAYTYIDGVAWHGYSGGPDAMARVHDAFPQKSAYWTEGGPDITAPDYLTDWAKWAETFNGILSNWSRSITAWNLALDENGKPNIGPFPCGGLVTVNSATHNVTRSGQYWALKHFSSHVRRGARAFRIEPAKDSALPSSTSITYSGFQNVDGSMVVIISNRGPETQVVLSLNSKSLAVALPKSSVHTLQW